MKKQIKMIAISILLVTSIIIIGMKKGYRLSFGTSESMEPTIHNYGMYITKEVPYKDIKEGDVITFNIRLSDEECERYHTEKGYNKLVTHRAMKMYETEKKGKVFHTKGDGNDSYDVWVVNKENYKNKVVKICNWKILSLLKPQYRSQENLNILVYGLYILAIISMYVIIRILIMMQSLIISNKRSIFLKTH